MKSVLISIRPKWVEKILSGEKTVEVRKTAPNIPTPFKCYIYETQGNTDTPWIDEEGHLIFKGKGKVVAEFICDKIQDCREIFIAPTCLTTDEWLKYTDGYKRTVWGWHISNLVIYEEPKTLSSFNKPCPYKLPDGSRMSVPCPCDKYTWGFDEKTGLSYCMRRMARPPQSWCYVEG